MIQESAQGHLENYVKHFLAGGRIRGDESIEDHVQRTNDQLGKIFLFLRLCIENALFDARDQSTYASWQDLAEKITVTLKNNSLPEQSVHWQPEHVDRHHDLRREWPTLKMAVENYFQAAHSGDAIAATV